MISIHDDVIHLATLCCVPFMIPARPEFTRVLRQSNFSVKLEVRGWLRRPEVFSDCRLLLFYLELTEDNFGVTLKSKIFPALDSGSVCVVSFGGFCTASGNYPAFFSLL